MRSGCSTIRRVNFAISAGQHPSKGIQHLGVQAENTDELAEAYGRLKRLIARSLKKAAPPAATRSREELDC